MTTKQQTALKDANGLNIQEGVYVDSAGVLVHVKQEQDRFVYTDYGNSGYITLAGYSTQLLGRIKNPRAQMSFLEKVLKETATSEQSSPKCKPKRIRVCELGHDIDEHDDDYHG